VEYGDLAFIANRRNFYVGDRITIVLNSENIEKLRNIQAKMIRTSPKSISFSHVLNLVVSEGLKKFKA
jgi:flagellar basal body L-ring protein FlgH